MGRGLVHLTSPNGRNPARGHVQLLEAKKWHDWLVRTTLKGKIMGLDMYLSAKKYFYSKNEEVAKEIGEKMGIDRPAHYVSFQAMQWRKCYKVNEWFIDRLSDNDIRQECEINREDLEKLLAQCKLSLEGKPCDFEDEEDPEDLKEEMEITVKGLEKCLKDFPVEYWFTYCASW